MKPNFTPGPWFVDHGVPGKPRIFSRADNLIKSMVCACEHGALSRQEHDAALIAAAPEMYSCLEEAIAEMCKDCPGKKADACNLEDGECIANKWITTLKKARGEK